MKFSVQADTTVRMHCADLVQIVSVIAKSAAILRVDVSNFYSEHVDQVDLYQVEDVLLVIRRKSFAGIEPVIHHFDRLVSRFYVYETCVGKIVDVIGIAGKHIGGCR